WDHNAPERRKQRASGRGVVAVTAEKFSALRPLTRRHGMFTSRWRGRRTLMDRKAFAQRLGLHPLVGFGMFALDWLMFGSEFFSAGVGAAVTVPVGVALARPSIFIRRRACGDCWSAAIGKGFLVGALTAVPRPLASLLTFLAGLL